MKRYKGIVLEEPALCAWCKKSYTRIAIQKGDGPVKPKCESCGQKAIEDLERKRRSLSRIRVGIWFRL